MLSIFNLKENSFRRTPTSSDILPWFGFKGLKSKFSGLIERSLQETPRICVLNRGKIGAGKTHVATFFSQPANLPIVSNNYSKVFSYLVESPKQANQAFFELYSRILNAISFEEIKKASERIRAWNSVDEATKKIQAITKNEDMSNVLLQISADNFFEVKLYLSGSGTVKDLRKIGVVRKLSTTHDYSNMLSGILALLIFSGESKENPFNRVILWIDEMEDLATYLTKFFLPFTSGLRELIDTLNDHFTLFLNFTFSAPNELPTIGSVLGDAIMSRINDHVVFEPPSKEDLRAYLLELFSNNRVREIEPNSIYPFDRGSFETLLATLDSRTPRYVNSLLDGGLRLLAKHPKVTGQTCPTISKELFEESLKEILPLIEDF